MLGLDTPGHTVSLGNDLGDSGDNNDNTVFNSNWKNAILTVSEKCE
jgi:hypothetical protein